MTFDREQTFEEGRDVLVDPPIFMGSPPFPSTPTSTSTSASGTNCSYHREISQYFTRLVRFASSEEYGFV